MKYNSRIHVNTRGIRLINLMLALLIAIMMMAGSMCQVEAASSSDGVEDQTIAAGSNTAFEIEKYDMTAKIGKDHSYKVKERITVYIPEDMASMKFVLTSGNFIVSDISSGGVNNVVSDENGTKWITLNDAKNLTAGEHTYTISYVIDELAERNASKDKLYFDALLPEWKQPIGKVDITVYLPDDFPYDDLDYYAGQFGIQDSGSKIKYHVDEADNKVTIQGTRIPENFGITLMADLPNGYWEGALDGIIFIYILGGVMLVVLAICLIMWIIGGRDPRVGKVKQTKPIEGITPVEVNCIYEGKVRIKDIIALVLYFGTKGYLRISEFEPKKYKLYRVCDPKGEERYMRNAYNILFEGVYQNRAIELTDAYPRFKRMLDAIQLDIKSGFSSPDMLPVKPISRVLRTISVLILSLANATIPVFYNRYQFIDISYSEPIAVFILSIITLQLCCALFDRQYDGDANINTMHIVVAAAAFLAVPGYELVKLAMLTKVYVLAAGIFGCILICMMLVLIMNSRGKGNAELVARFKSLRKFIYRAKSKDVIAYYQDDINYYYDMVPYAYLFHGLETWARTWKWLGVRDPEWLTDDIEGDAIKYARRKMTTVDYARMVKSFSRTIEAKYNLMHHRSFFRD